MKSYEQLFFDLLKEYQQTPQQTLKNPKTSAVVEILKKANITDQNLIKTITDLLETDEDTQQKPASTPTSTPVVPTVTSTSNIKA